MKVANFGTNTFSRRQEGVKEARGITLSAGALNTLHMANREKSYRTNYTNTRDLLWSARL